MHGEMKEITKELGTAEVFTFIISYRLIKVFMFIENGFRLNVSLIYMFSLHVLSSVIIFSVINIAYLIIKKKAKSKSKILPGSFRKI